jgi:hypothetical protein
LYLDLDSNFTQNTLESDSKAANAKYMKITKGDTEKTKVHDVVYWSCLILNLGMDSPGSSSPPPIEVDFNYKGIANQGLGKSKGKTKMIQSFNQEMSLIIRDFGGYVLKYWGMQFLHSLLSFLDIHLGGKWHVLENWLQTDIEICFFQMKASGKNLPWIRKLVLAMLQWNVGLKYLYFPLIRLQLNI